MEWLITLYLVGMAIISVGLTLSDKKYTFSEFIVIVVFYPIILLVWGTFIVLLLIVTLLAGLIGVAQMILKGGKNND